MTQPIRIQRRRTKGWTKPENTVDVTRSSQWGNPYIVGKDGTLDEVLDKFERHHALPLANHVKKELRGKNLMCWCPLHQKCHADILLRIANEPDSEVY
jgi:hypothetical protein